MFALCVCVCVALKTIKPGNYLFYKVKGPPSNVFFLSTSAYFMNGKLSYFSFILPPNEYGCVYTGTTVGNIVTLL